MVKGWSVRVRVWSRAGRSEGGCDPGLEDQNEGVVQGWTIRVRVCVVQGCRIGVRVWSMAGRSTEGVVQG